MDDYQYGSQYMESIPSIAASSPSEPDEKIVHYPSSIYVNQEPTAIVINHPDLIVQPAPIVFHKPAAVVQNPNYRPGQNENAPAAHKQQLSEIQTKKCKESRTFEQKINSNDFKSIHNNNQKTFNSNLVKKFEESTAYEREKLVTNANNQNSKFGPKIYASYNFNLENDQKWHNQFENQKEIAKNSFFGRKLKNVENLETSKHKENTMRHHKFQSKNLFDKFEEKDSNQIRYQEHLEFNRNEKKLQETTFERKSFQSVQPNLKQKINEAEKQIKNDNRLHRYSNVQDMEKILMPPKVNVFHGDKAINFNTKLLPPYFQSKPDFVSPAVLNEESTQFINRFDKRKNLKNKCIQSEIKNQFGGHNIQRHHNQEYLINRRPDIDQELTSKITKKMENYESTRNFDQYIPIQTSHRKYDNSIQSRNYENYLQSAEQYFKDDTETPNKVNNFAYENYLNYREKTKSNYMDEMPIEKLPQNDIEYYSRNRPEYYNEEANRTPYQDGHLNREEPIIMTATAAASNQQPIVYYGNYY